MDNHQNPYESPQTHDPQAELQATRRQNGNLSASVDTAIEISKDLWNNHASTLLTAWGTLSAFWLVSTLVMSFGMLMLGLDPASQNEIIERLSTGDAHPLAIFDMFGPGYWALVGLSMVTFYIQMGLGIASFGPVRVAWREKRTLSTAEVLGQMGNGIARGSLFMLLFSIAFAIGIVLCCIPGLVVGYFTLPAFYLVGRGDGIFDSFSTSFKWAKRHATLLVLLIGISIGIGLVMMCLMTVGSSITLMMGNVGYILSQVISWFLGTFFGFVIWLFYSGTMLAIDGAEEHATGA